MRPRARGSTSSGAPSRAPAPAPAGRFEAPANALAYSWKHFIGGHLGRLGSRDDVTLHQQYMADISESSRKAIVSVDPTRYFVKYGENMWAAVKGYLDEVTRVAATPVIEKYTGVLAAADVFTESTTFWVMESIRLDLGYGPPGHPCSRRRPPPPPAR